MTPYPASFPSECIDTLIEIAVNRQIVERKAEVALHGWNVQGYAQGKLLGGPQTMSADEQSRVGELVKAYAEACNVAQYDTSAIDWQKWIKFFIEVILPIIIA